MEKKFWLEGKVSTLKDTLLESSPRKSFKLKATIIITHLFLLLLSQLHLLALFLDL